MRSVEAASGKRRPEGHWTEDRRRTRVQTQTLDRHPPARNRAPLELDRAADEGARAADVCREQAGRRPPKRDGRSDADLLRGAPAAVPARQVRRPDCRLRQVAPGPVRCGQNRRDRSERAFTERLCEQRHRLPGTPGRHRSGERDTATVDDPGRRGRERDADRRERDIGAATRSRIARGDDPVVVRRPRREAREQHADASRSRAGSRASPRRLRPVPRRCSVLDVPRGCSPARVDRAHGGRGRRADTLCSIRAHLGRQRRTEASIAADDRAGRIRGDQAEVVGRRRPEARQRLGHVDCAGTRACVPDRGPRAVAAARSVVEVPTRRLPVRRDGSVQPRRGRRDRARRARHHCRRSDRRERLVGAAARPGVARRDEAVVVETAARQAGQRSRDAHGARAGPAFFSAVFEP